MYVYVCMCVCLCVYVSMCVCVYVCMCMCMCVCVYVYVCVYVCMCVCVCVHVCMCMCVYACVHVCMYVCMCMCVCVCVHVYMCKKRQCTGDKRNQYVQPTNLQEGKLISSFRDSLGWLVFMISVSSIPTQIIDIKYHQLPMFRLQYCSLLQGTSYNTGNTCSLNTIIR